MATISLPKQESPVSALINKALGKKRFRGIRPMMSAGTIVVADGNPSNTDTLAGMPAKAFCYVPTTGRVYFTNNTGTTWARLDG